MIFVKSNAMHSNRKLRRTSMHNCEGMRMREIIVEECECVRRNSAKGDKTAVKSDEYEWLRVQAGDTHVISPRGSSSSTASGDHTVCATADRGWIVCIDWGGGVLCGLAEEGNEGVHLRIEDEWESRLEGARLEAKA